MFQFTTEEVADLKDLARKYCFDRSPVKESSGVEPYYQNKGGPFLHRWLSRQGFPKARLAESGIWKFSNVHPHTDDIFSDAYWVAMIPLYGMGEFYWVNKDKLIEKKFNEFREPIIFNDKKPHSFYSNRPCFAILGIIPARIAKKLLAV